jgi:hypothetical protein
VVLRVAARRHPQASDTAPDKAANRVFGAFERVENFVGGTQQTLAGAREHHAFADAEKDLRAEMRFDIPQLVAERGLREMQLAPGARQPAQGRDRANEPEVPDFEIHDS